MEKEEKTEEFVSKCLEIHNAHREQHGVPPLAKAEDLCSSAQKWAEYLAEINMVKHSENDEEELGESIAFMNQRTSDAKTVCDNWYGENEIYNFETGQPLMEWATTGHFCQMVWKGSKEMGVGRAVAEDGNVYVVAKYRPTGNKPGEFLDNVLPHS